MKDDILKELNRLYEIERIAIDIVARKLDKRDYELELLLMHLTVPEDKLEKRMDYFRDCNRPNGRG